MLCMSATTTDLYDLPQEYKDFRATIREIVDGEIRPRAAEIDAKGEYPWDIRKLLGEQDILGLPFAEEYGGTGTGTLMLQIAVEENRQGVRLERADPHDPGAGHAADHALRLRRAQGADPPEVRHRRMVAGLRAERARAGSDPASLRTSAVRDGDAWVINGTKNWITNASIADYYVVFAVTDREQRRLSAFVVEADREGVSVPSSSTSRHQGLADRLAGVRGRPRPAREHDRRRGQGPGRRARHAAVHAPGRRGAGRRHRAGSDRLRQPVPKERITFGKPINEFQAIAFKLADMETRTAAARELLYKACAMADRREPGLAKYTSMAKLFASDTAMWVTVEAIQVLGGYGYVTEYRSSA